MSSFPEVIDNTMLKDWRRCPQYFFRKRIQGLKPIDEGIPIDLHYGQCLAKGMEVARTHFYQVGDYLQVAQDLGVIAAKNLWDNQDYSGTGKGKTRESLEAALRYAFKQWPLEEDDIWVELRNEGVEYEFKIRLPIEHPETGKPLWYAGRCDFVSKDADGNVVVVDEKTSGNLSDAWVQQWLIDPQMSGYIWAMRKHFPDSYQVYGQVRGISAYALKSGEIRVSHSTVDIVRTEHQIKLWEEQMLEDVASICLQWKAYGMNRCMPRVWPYRLGSACTAYGRACEFMRLCNATSPERIAQDSYKVEFWSPLTKGNV